MSSDITLAFETYNAAESSTIVLIHGAFSSPREYFSVASHLPTYHILIPSLPAHGDSWRIPNFSLSLSTRLLADLIREHAKDGKAHVTGVSLGAVVAIALAGEYPDVVSTVFASGYNRFTPSIWNPALPYLIYGVQHLTDKVPDRVYKYFMDGAERVGEDHTICTLALSREIRDTLVTEREILPVQARTLVVAATKRDMYLPTNDNLEDARLVWEAVKKGNQESRVMEVKTVRHPWNLQDPALFARSVMAWIEGRALPDEFTEL